METTAQNSYDWKTIGNVLAISALWGALQFLTVWGSGGGARPAAMAAAVNMAAAAANQLQRTGQWMPTTEGLRK